MDEQLFSKIMHELIRTVLTEAYMNSPYLVIRWRNGGQRSELDSVEDISHSGIEDRIKTIIDIFESDNATGVDLHFDLLGRDWVTLLAYDHQKNENVENLIFIECGKVERQKHVDFATQNCIQKYDVFEYGKMADNFIAKMSEGDEKEVFQDILASFCFQVGRLCPDESFESSTARDLLIFYFSKVVKTHRAELSDWLLEKIT